jgi:hypothetical protein
MVLMMWIHNLSRMCLACAWCSSRSCFQTFNLLYEWWCSCYCQSRADKYQEVMSSCYQWFCYPVWVLYPKKMNVISGGIQPIFSSTVEDSLQWYTRQVEFQGKDWAFGSEKVTYTIPFPFHSLVIHHYFYFSFFHKASMVVWPIVARREWSGSNVPVWPSLSLKC